MWAIVNNRYGSPDDLKLHEIDKPTVGDDAVLISKSKYRAGLDREASDFRRAIGTLASHLSDVSTESDK